MKADGADKWSGQVYNAEDGKTYSGSFALCGATKPDLKGCRGHHLQDRDLVAHHLAKPLRHFAHWPNRTVRTPLIDVSNWPVQSPTLRGTA